MLTVLSVDKRMPKGKIGTILGRLPVNSMKLTEKTEQGIEMRHLQYVCRNGRIDWRKISRKVRDGRINLIYSGDDEILADSGIVPFSPWLLRQRLCGNMAVEVLELLKETPKNLKVGIYDPWGDFCDLAECVLKYVSDVVAVTKNPALYAEQARRILDETGAVLCVSRNMYSLSECGLIISPDRLDERFTPMTKAILLTCIQPCVPLGCRVYYRYSFRLPEKFEKLRPEDTDAEIFGGALYSLCQIYELGSIVPFVCVSNTDTQTTLSLRKYLWECFGT